MDVERLAELELAGETKALGGDQFQCQFVHHKSHMTCYRIRAAAVESRQSNSLGDDAAK
jgi:hypothetical protein